MISSIVEVRKSVERDGFAVFYPCLSADACDLLANELNQSTAGTRNLLQLSSVHALACSDQVRSLATSILGRACFAVKATLFNKNSRANWKVSWHQDRMIAVKSRKEVSGFKLWAVKEDVLHVQPPEEVMAKMLAVRLHIDDCPIEAGPLKVVPRSHECGYLSDHEVRELSSKSKPVICTVPRGGAILMRPLAVHSSSKCEIPINRRVIHIEFTSQELPSGLEWHDRVA